MKEVWKSNLRQDGQMTSRGGKSQKRKAEEKVREEEKEEDHRRESQDKEDAGARKGRKVVTYILCFSSVFCGLKGRKVGLLKRWVKMWLHSTFSYSNFL